MYPPSSPTKGRTKALCVRIRVEVAQMRRSPLRLCVSILFSAAFVWLASVAWIHRGYQLGGSVISAADAATIAASTRALELDAQVYSPSRSVGFAIPVGGRTERSAGLEAILHRLLDGGAPASSIVIFEDVLGRPGAQASSKVRDMVDRINQQLRDKDAAATPAAGQIKIVHTQIDRSAAETAADFGIHLARHYKSMLDWMLVGDTPMQALERNALIQIGLDSSAAPSKPVAPFEYAVVIEDDLELSADFVKFFFELSRVMRVDSTVYCVAAHQDNAFLATSAEEQFDPAVVAAGGATLDPMQFAFRRGNHFMAPGWMTSRSIYVHTVRPKWLDQQGQYTFKEALHLKNGHWDRFFDSLIGSRDCIFPEVPRIIHQGAEGFTVSKKGQMELYSNLRLSALSPAVNYGPLVRLTQEGWRQSQVSFILSARTLSVLEESVRYRDSALVYVLPARDDRDGEWNAVLNEYFGLIGVGGYGGWVGYVKLRGVSNGAVIVRWMSNRIMLIGAYSPLVALVAPPAPQWNPNNEALPLQFEGCFPASAFRDGVNHYTRASVSPSSCLLSCIHLGFRFGAIVSADRCACRANLLSADLTPLVPSSSALCTASCLGSAAHSSLRSTMVQSLATVLGPKHSCGGPQHASVYRLVDPPADPTAAAAAPSSGVQLQSLDPEFPGLSLVAPRDALYMSAGESQSCTDACDAAGARCDESLFPLIAHSCPSLQRLLQCTRCASEPDVEKGFSTPGRSHAVGASDVCTFAKGKYVQCQSKPTHNFIRGCVCKRTATNTQTTQA